MCFCCLCIVLFRLFTYVYYSTAPASRLTPLIHENKSNKLKCFELFGDQNNPVAKKKVRPQEFSSPQSAVLTPKRIRNKGFSG